MGAHDGRMQEGIVEIRRLFIQRKGLGVHCIQPPELKRGYMLRASVRGGAQLGFAGKAHGQYFSTSQCL